MDDEGERGSVLPGIEPHPRDDERGCSKKHSIPRRVVAQKEGKTRYMQKLF